MKKFLYILCICFLNISLMGGCKVNEDTLSSNNDIQDSQVTEEETPNLKNETNNIKEKAEKNIIEFHKIIPSNLPEYYSFYDYLDKGRFIGLTKNKPFIYNLEKDSITILSNTNYWNIALAPDKNKVAFNNENGIGILNITGGKEEVVLRADYLEENQIFISDFFWSPNSSMLLLKEDLEFGAKYSILDLNTNAITALDIEGLLFPLKWITQDKIIFEEFYLYPKSGEGEYQDGGTRDDLVIYNVQNKIKTKLTDNNDGEYIELIDSNKEALFIAKQKDEEYTLMKLDTATEILTELGPMKDPILNMKSERDYLVRRSLGRVEMNDKAEILLVNNGIENKLCEWTYTDYSLATFYIGNTIFVSSNYGSKLDNNNFVIKYGTELYRIEASSTFSHDEALNLINKAFDIYWEVSFDHNDDTDSKLELDGKEYMYLNDKYNTKDKLIQYLNQAYTKEFSSFIFDSLGYKEHGGRLYHEYGELGTLMEWHNSTIVNYDNLSDEKVQLQIRVPVGDGNFEERSIELIKESEAWKVNTLLDY